MKLAAELIMAEFSELVAHRMRINAADIGAEPKRAGIVSIVEDPLPSRALNALCASFPNVDQKIIRDSAEENGRPEIKLSVHAAKIQESAEKVNQ